jgi:hypothetical protein
MGTTMGSKQIAEVLSKDGHKVSHMAVHRYLTEHLEQRKEAAEVVKAEVQAELQKQALSDVQMLENLRDELHKKVLGRPEERMADDALWLKASKELRETITTRLTKAGAGGEDGITVKLDLL